MIKNRLLLLFSLLMPALSFAQANNSNLKGLLFEASRNNLKPSPQRFEYKLESPLLLQIGDIRIDMQGLKLQLEGSETRVEAVLQWPHSLFETGEITIVDSVGKALARRTFTTKDFIINRETENKDEDGPRTTLGQLVWTSLPSDFVQKLRGTAFFRFCLNRQDGETRITLCSPESFFSGDPQDLRVQMRSPFRQARIEINSEPVGKQGVVYLNDTNEEVRFRAETEMGAFLELNTRSQDVNFEDIVSIGDGSRLLITAKGAEPVNLKRIRRLGDGLWQTVLSAQRPVLYMRGEGNIPLRQDFYIAGSLPKISDRLYVQKNMPREVYSSEFTLLGHNPEKLSISLVPGDERSQLNVVNEQFEWALKDLKPNQVNRYELEVGTQKFRAHYDVFRGDPFSLDGGFFYNSVNSFGFRGDFRWWIENFANNSNSWAQLHWGLGLIYSKGFDNEKDVSDIHARLYWRSQSGLQRRQSSWGTIFDYWNLSAAGAQSSIAGVGAFLSQEASKDYQEWMSWYEIEAVAHILPLGSNSSVQSAVDLNGKAFKLIRENWNAYYGVGGTYYSVKNGTADPQLYLQGGASWTF